MLKDRIREARQQAGLKQKEVAQIIGVTESTYCCYEIGKREPDALKIKAIAEALNVSGDFLLELETTKAPVFTEAESQLMQIFRQLDEDGQADCLNLAKALLKRHAQKNHTDSVNEIA